jgi:benzylsuccinate CoA-transferase BbsF subunit
LMEAASSGKNPEPTGNISFSVAPHGCYPCKGEDRWCVIAAETEAQWTALASILGGEVVGNTRFATNAARLRERDALDKIISEWTQTRDAFAVRDQLQKAGVPAGVVQTGEDLVNDPQLKERGFIVEVDNARLGKVVLPNFPLHFTNAKLTRRWEFPVLGKDTETVLREIVGYDEATIAAHRRDGVLE